MTPLPPQSPEVPPRYRFRLPRDRGYIAPPFRAPLSPRVTFQPYEPNEPRSDIELRELDPVLLVAAVMTVLGGGALLVFVFTS